MCGLAGMAGGGINKDDIEAFNTLVYITGLRGLDGTGVVQGRSYERSTQFKTIKSAMDVPLFQHHHRTIGDKNLLMDPFENFYMVHCRAATLGEITAENAHPFEFDNIIGMHNGTLRDEKYRKDKTKTDSEQLFADINENGVIPVLEELSESSAYALVMYDRHSGEIIFVRNGLRPLWFAVNKLRSVIYWSSERDMLEFMADRHGLEIGPIGYATTHSVYTLRPWKVNANNWPAWEKVDFKPKWLIAKEAKEKAEAEKKASGGGTVGVVVAESSVVIKGSGVEQLPPPPPLSGKETAAKKAGKTTRENKYAKEWRAKPKTVKEVLEERHEQKPRFRVTADGNFFQKLSDGSYEDTPTKLRGRDYTRIPQELPKEKCSHCSKQMSLVETYFGTVRYNDDGVKQVYCSVECSSKANKRAALNDLLDEAIASMTKD